MGFHARVSCGTIVAVWAAVTITGCGGGSAPPPGTAGTTGSGDAAFDALVSEVLTDEYTRNPTSATDLGIHQFDNQLEDYSRAGIDSAMAAARGFKTRVEAVDQATLSPAKQLDREFVIHALDSRILLGTEVKGWAKDPDSYSSGITNTAYVMFKRQFAPPEDRLRALIAREQKMPAALAEARKNLENPPHIYTEIAIDQLDGDIDLFKSAVPEAFAGVKDAALLKDFKTANAAVIEALTAYKAWLQKDLLPRSKGEFAYGADLYHRRLIADEMIDTPLDELLRIAEADLHKNQAAFAEAAKRIDPKKTPMEVQASIELDHPTAGKLLEATQATLDAIGKFLVDKQIITVPSAAQARVKETPPFMRATTFASMDTPGPFETHATEAFYNVTLPDPAWSAKETEDYMRGWYYALISNVSVHEAWPGHYLQFLYAKGFPSDVRKVFGATSNIEGWAHYCEQMVIDEGFHADDPKYRLAQLQDALLRDSRFIVGIRMHTQGMTMAQAEEFFQKEGYQVAPVARSETKRGTNDATYGYYTMGKLMILKLRDDYKAHQAAVGGTYSLQGFHDAFIKLGPLQLPLMRKALLGDVGTIF
jgi:uncharacterized protein (DUF885 family)